VTAGPSDRVREALAAARRVLVITGAGVSAESGIPTFRGRDGWWRKLDPARLATPAAFAADPRLVWEWYDHRRRIVAAAEPNPAHRALAALPREGREVLLVTQNVDDLHERAGSRGVIHLHGSIWTVRCTAEGTEREDRRAPLEEIPPRCGCGALLRPGVVWFGEMLPAGPSGAVEEWVREGADLVLVVGTEASFGYVLDWAVRARRPGGLLVEVNPGDTALTPEADLALRGPAGTILPGLLAVTS
jgi:NAD-dependent deacetylase